MGKMKRIYFYILAVGMMMLMGACSNDDNSPVKPTKTVLVYMAARNDLANAAKEDLREIKEGSKLIGENDQMLVFVRRYVADEEPWSSCILISR